MVLTLPSLLPKGFSFDFSSFLSVLPKTLEADFAGSFFFSSFGSDFDSSFLGSSDFFLEKGLFFWLEELGFEEGKGEEFDFGFWEEESDGPDLKGLLEGLVEMEEPGLEEKGLLDFEELPP